MNEEVYIFEVSESGFPRYVIDNSNKIPVLALFLGAWSEPCIRMADTLHDLAHEFAGQFVVAKIDVDEQPGLRDQFDINNVPTLLAIRDEQVQLQQEGQMQEEELRTLLKGLGVFRVSDELRQQARAKHLAGDTPGAILLLTQAIKDDPGNTRIAMDMVQIFIDIGELDQARSLYNKLPEADKDTSMGKSLTGQLNFAELAGKTQGIDALTAALAADDNDYNARFDLAVCLVAKSRYQDAMDQLFTLLSQAPDFRNGAAREMIITITNMLQPNDPEQAQTYRRRLSSMLAE